MVAVGADRDGIEGLARAERAGVAHLRAPSSSDFTDRDGVGPRALADTVAAFDPDLVVLGRVHEAGRRPDFLARFGGRMVNTHPALLPSFPGMHGPARRAGVRRQGHRRTLFVVDDGVDTGPIVAQARCRSSDDDTVESLHERIKVAERAMLVDAVGRMAREGFTITDRKVRFGHELTRTSSDRDRDQARPGLRLRQDRARGPGPRAARGRRRARLHRRLGRAHQAARRPGHPGRGADRLPRVPRRPGQDPAPARARRHPRRPAPRLPRARSSPSSAIEPFDLVVVNLYPFTETVASGATPDECVEQIDIGGPSMVRAAAKNHPSVAVVTSPARYADVLAAVAAGGFTLAERQRLAAEAFAHTAAYDVAVANWFGRAHRRRRGRRLARLRGCDLGARRRCCATARTRTRRRRSTPTAAGGLAQAEQLHGKEMSYNNYVDTDAARRAAYDFDAAGRGDHQARQPVRHRGRRRRRRGAPQGARVRPGVGLRRGHRRQPPGHGGDGRARWPRCSPR